MTYAKGRDPKASPSARFDELPLASNLADGLADGHGTRQSNGKLVRPQPGLRRLRTSERKAGEGSGKKIWGEGSNRAERPNALIAFEKRENLHKLRPDSLDNTKGSHSDSVINIMLHGYNYY